MEWSAYFLDDMRTGSPVHLVLLLRFGFCNGDRKGACMQTGIIVAVIILILFFLLWTAIEQKLLVTTRYTVASSKLPNAFHNTHFVVLADLHNYNFGKQNERLAGKIEKLAPEFIIVAGDMMNKNASCYPSNAYTLLSRLAERYKIYYAYGNHEQKMERLQREYREGMTPAQKELYSTWLEYKGKLVKKNVTFLNNESVILTKNREKLRITGVSIDRKFFERSKMKPMEKGYLNSLIGAKLNKSYTIMIAHNPVYFKEYTEWGADLTLCGHLHGGLVRLPFIGGVISPQVRLFPKYSAGNYTEKEQQMIVSRGLGSHSLMPRIWNVPEIVSIKLKRKN
jgi:predicted MPP superfamily phosphohydrolase